MVEYLIVHDMKMQGKSIIVLDRKRENDDMEKCKIAIDNKLYDYSLTHGDNSLIVDTLLPLKGKTASFI